MVAVLHVYLQLTEDELVVILGGTYLVTNDGTKLIAGAGACPLDRIA